MARGIIPRQPSKSGRHEGRRAPVRGTSPLQKSAPPTRVKPPVKSEAKVKRAEKSAGAKPPKGCNPVAPERVREILKRLDATYPNVTCALQHKSAWE
jgi:endonuclease-3